MKQKHKPTKKGIGMLQSSSLFEVDEVWVFLQDLSYELAALTNPKRLRGIEGHISRFNRKKQEVKDTSFGVTQLLNAVDMAKKSITSNTAHTSQRINATTLSMFEIAQGKVEVKFQKDNGMGGITKDKKKVEYKADLSREETSAINISILQRFFSVFYPNDRLRKRLLKKIKDAYPPKIGHGGVKMTYTCDLLHMKFFFRSTENKEKFVAYIRDEEKAGVYTILKSSQNHLTLTFGKPNYGQHSKQKPPIKVGGFKKLFGFLIFSIILKHGYI